jgi:hypothetical protein
MIAGEFPHQADALARLEATPRGYRLNLPSLGYRGLEVEINPSDKLTMAQEEHARRLQQSGYSWRLVETEREAVREIVSYACLKQYAEFDCFSDQ